MELNAEHKVRIKDALHGIRLATNYAQDPIRSDTVSKDMFIAALLQLFVAIDNAGVLQELISEIARDLNG